MQRAINEQNERVKRKYAVWKREARRAHTTTVDKALEAIDAFTAFTKGKDFKSFTVEQAIGFKRHLESRANVRTGRPLAKATIDGTSPAIGRRSSGPISSISTSTQRMPASPMRIGTFRFRRSSSACTPS
jgi:hypothetical protein